MMMRMLMLTANRKPQTERRPRLGRLKLHVTCTSLYHTSDIDIVQPQTTKPKLKATNFTSPISIPKQKQTQTNNKLNLTRKLKLVK